MGLWDASLGRIVKITDPGGLEFDIMDLVTRVPVEPAGWWRIWFQDALDAIMKFTPARTRTYFIRLVVVPFIQPGYPFAIEVINTSWAGDPEYQWALALDPSIAASPDLLLANTPATEPPRTPTARLRFAAALRHELIHLMKHRATHKKGPLAIEPEAYAGQRDFLLKAARHFGVSTEERDRLIEENKQAERERLANIRGNI